jgi:hypothetical protein
MEFPTEQSHYRIRGVAKFCHTERDYQRRMTMTKFQLRDLALRHTEGGSIRQVVPLDDTEAAPANEDAAPPLVQCLRTGSASRCGNVLRVSSTYHPVATGGRGRSNMHDFYADHFIRGNPPGIPLGFPLCAANAKRVAAEMGAWFTHEIEIPQMLPAIVPTGKRVETRGVAVVAFHDRNLESEHTC